MLMCIFMKKQKQLAFKIKTWGGKRKGAGRPNLSRTVNHMKRETVTSRTPVMITVKFKPELNNMRCDLLHDQLKKSFVGAREVGLRVNHYSLEGNHLHVFAEAKDNEILARGMMSFGSSFGKATRKYNGGSGSVFVGRYHVRVLRTPTQAKNALAYVLINRTKHLGANPNLDPFSSNIYFREWDKLLGKKVGPYMKGFRGVREKFPEYLSPPQSWLAREGWMRAVGSAA